MSQEIKTHHKQEKTEELRAERNEQLYAMKQGITSDPKVAANVREAMYGRLAEGEKPELVVNKKQAERKNAANISVNAGQVAKQEQDIDDGYNPNTNVLTNDANPAYEEVSAQILNTSMGPSFVISNPDLFETRTMEFLQGLVDKQPYAVTENEALLNVMRIQEIAEGRNRYVAAQSINYEELAFTNEDAYELSLEGYSSSVRSIARGCADYVAAQGVDPADPVSARVNRREIEEVRKIEKAYTAA